MTRAIDHGRSVGIDTRIRIGTDTGSSSSNSSKDLGLGIGIGLDAIVGAGEYSGSARRGCS